jgi:hypothetical protein
LEDRSTSCTPQDAPGATDGSRFTTARENRFRWWKVFLEIRQEPLEEGVFIVVVLDFFED